jgi:uncharacterized protein (DUF1330 family)
MPKAYLVAHIRVHDPEEFERFKDLSQHAINEHGCRVLARNPNPEIKEGDVSGTVILIEFDDIAAARAFYASDAYRAARAEREVSATTDLMLVEGV